MVKIAVCDDEKTYIDEVLKIIDNIEDTEITTYISPKELLDSVNEFDIFVIDIEMPEIDGMFLAKEIREAREDAIIIFLTNYDNFVFDAYEVGAFRYIQKSKISEKLFIGVKQAVEKIENANNGKLINISSDKMLAKKINIRDIVLLEKFKKDVIIRTKNKDTITLRATLKEMLSKIDSPEFIEIRKGVVVNVAYVRTIERYKLILTDDTELFISRGKLDEVRKNMLHYWSK